MLDKIDTKCFGCSDSSNRDKHLQPLVVVNVGKYALTDRVDVKKYKLSDEQIYEVQASVISKSTVQT